MNKNYSRAKVLTLIPIFMLAFSLICMVFASILEVPTSKGVLYTVFAFAGLISMFLNPFPSLVMSIFGTVFASKAKKEGETKANKFFILGILEIVASVIGIFLAIVMLIIGQGV